MDTNLYDDDSPQLSACRHATDKQPVSWATQPSDHVLIKEVLVDFGPPDSLTIREEAFDFGNTLTVSLGEFGPLVILTPEPGS